MKEKKNSEQRLFLILAFLVIACIKVSSQSSMPEVLTNGTQEEQLNYIEERTRIYENYRAIREDMFQKIKNNMTDSLLSAKNKISSLNSRSSKLNYTIDSLKTTLDDTKTQLKEITRTKNSIKVFGMEVNKTAYNSVMWLIIVALAFILGTGFLTLKRNLTVTHNIKMDLQELKDEFEAYRKTTREAREKMSMDHFNELKRLKGG